MFRITYTKAAMASLRGMQAPVAGRIMDKMEQIAVDPYHAPVEVRPLRGREEWRLRVGGWRVLFAVDRVRETLHVKAVLPRGRAYR